MYGIYRIKTLRGGVLGNVVASTAVEAVGFAIKQFPHLDANDVFVSIVGPAVPGQWC